MNVACRDVRSDLPIISRKVAELKPTNLIRIFTYEDEVSKEQNSPGRDRAVKPNKRPHIPNHKYDEGLTLEKIVHPRRLLICMSPFFSTVLIIRCFIARSTCRYVSRSLAAGVRVFPGTPTSSSAFT